MTWLAYSALGVPKRVELTTQPAGAQAGIAFTVQPVGRLVDGSGVLARVQGTTVTASRVAGTGALSGTTAQATVDGVFTYTNLAMSLTEAAVQLGFASAGLTSATSNPFNITTANTIIGIAAGSYTTTGTAVTLTRGPYMMRQDASGSYTVTGAAVALAYSGAAVLFTETFADSSFAARDWYSIVSADRVTTPAPVGMPGSLRMSWNIGQTVPSSGGMRKLFASTDRLYIKYQQSFSSNWVGSGTSSHPHLVMALSDADDAYAGPSDNYLAFYSEVTYNGGNRPMVKFQDNQYIDNAHIGTNFSEARSTCGANGQQGYADSWDLYSDNGFSQGWACSRNLTAGVAMATGNTAWHTVEIEVILNSIVGGVGQLDGVCRYWWDGVLIWSRTNLIMRTNSRPNLRLNQFLFAPYIGNGSPVAQTTYIADLTVGTSRNVVPTFTIDPGVYTVTGTAATLTYSGGVSGWLANKPASYTNVITDYAFNDVIPASTADAYVGDIWSTVFNGSGDTRRVVDTTGGISPQYVLENHYPAGHASGTGVGQIFGSVSGSVREFYVCMRVKFSSNYEWNTISNKFFIFEPDHIILESRHYGDYWAFDDQGLDVYSNCNVATPTTPLNQWVTVEFIVKRGGASVGGLKLWMDGVLYMDRTQAVSNTAGGQEVSINTTWGGGTGPMSTESWRWVDHVYIASP